MLALEGAEGAAGADGIVGDSVLLIADPAKIDPDEILVVRKRMATPMTTPAVEAELQRLAWPGREPTADTERASPEEVAELHAHLQQLCDTEVNPAAPPALFTAGLSALMSLWLALVSRGGADVLMCSTAYGGSSQCTDLVAERTDRFRKSTFDVQGDQSIDLSIEAALDTLGKAIEELHASSGKPQADLARTLRLETMIDIREVCDAAEGLCPADLWTLPTYTDLLFLDQTTNVDKNYFP